jgi:hypothetical protein
MIAVVYLLLVIGASILTAGLIIEEFKSNKK